MFFEIDNSCAYRGVKQGENLSKHHIDGDDTNNAYVNQIILCHHCHYRVTNGKGITLDDILVIKEILIHKTLAQYGVDALKLVYRKKGRIVAIPFLLYYLVDMGYFKQTGVEMWQDEIDILASYELTNEG